MKRIPVLTWQEYVAGREVVTLDPCLEYACIVETKPETGKERLEAILSPSYISPVSVEYTVRAVRLDRSWLLDGKFYFCGAYRDKVYRSHSPGHTQRYRGYLYIRKRYIEPYL